MKHLETIADRLREDPSVLFITGAGLSADSGLPTYRGIGSLYSKDVDGIPMEAAVSGPMFRIDPAVTWKALHRLSRASSSARPNRGHYVITQLQQRLSRVVVFTQNVDGFHLLAGTDAVRLHGYGGGVVCPECDWFAGCESYAELAPVPRCPECGAVVRPPCILFGEMLQPEVVRRVYDELEPGFDVVISVGTSSLFPYISGPVRATRAAGGMTVEINPGSTEVSEIVDYRVRMSAAVALGHIAHLLGLPVVTDVVQLCG